MPDISEEELSRRIPALMDELENAARRTPDRSLSRWRPALAGAMVALLLSAVVLAVRLHSPANPSGIVVPSPGASGAPSLSPTPLSSGSPLGAAPLAASQGCSTVTTVVPVDADVVWVSTQAGVDLSTNGGETWHSVTIPGNGTNTNLDLDAVSPTTVLALETGYKASAKLELTTDGGLQWKSVVGVPSNATCIDFLSPEQGYTITATGLFETADGGTSWGRIAAAGDATSTCFTANGVGYVSVPADLMVTTNAGSTWTATAVPDSASLGTSADISCSGSDVVMTYGTFTLGMSVNANDVISSEDEGAHWTAISAVTLTSPDQVGSIAEAPGLPQAQLGYPLDCQLSATGEIWAMAQNDRSSLSLSLSTNDGASFSPVLTNAPAAAGADAVPPQFASNNIGWMAVGYPAAPHQATLRSATRDGGILEGGLSPDWAIFTTTDGGMTWTRTAVFVVTGGGDD